jgi:1-acyl-sn-glycerol-3-phosphate acyltransferase
MLGNILNNIINFFINRKVLFLFVLIVFLGIFFLGIFKINVNESIFSMLPKGNSFSKFSKILDQGDLSNQVVFRLDVENSNLDEINKICSILSDSLQVNSKDYLKEIVIERENLENDVFDYFYTNFPAFINENYYLKIESRIDSNKIKEHFSNSQRNLLAPSGFLLKEFILKDPLSLSGDFFNTLNKESNFSNLNIENGFVFTEDKKQLLIVAKTTFSITDNKKNIKLYNLLNNITDNWNKQYPMHQLTYFGTFQIGAENGIQVKKDTFLTLIITLIVILLILFIFYRKILIPIYFMFPLVFGGLFALGMMGYFKSEVSGISIATGAVVFGIILDYSFHFFTHLQHTNSINQTIKEISTPLLTGGFTTIMAFAALLFTNSVVLQDFGLFAALSLSGAAFFTLTGLPVILKLFRFNYSIVKGKSLTLNISIPNSFRKIFIFLIIVLTGTFLYFSGDVTFDDDLDNLSYHSQKLKDRENDLVGINPEKEKKLYLFTEAKSYEIASIYNHNLYLKIKDLQLKGKIKSSLSVGKFIVPDSIAERRLIKWSEFWQPRQEKFFNEFDNVADSLGFNKEAFVPFKKWIKSSSLKENKNDVLLKELGLKDLIFHDENRTTFITTVVVDKELVSDIQSELTVLQGISTFNRAEVAKELLTSVKNDFNYILLVSSLLVFFSLLIIYGRIEMALFTFIPMLISWIWILGIAGLFGLKFNFINIVIATFIFGLGDDFSIFITDGLLHKYKHKKNTISSYNMAIVLSALTTIVGTGVLFFAKHPAIHSVSIISVIGILCVLLISIIVQPFLFDLFIQKRINHQKPPLTLIAFIVSLYEFSWWVIGCIFSYTVLITLFILPLPKRIKRKVLNSVISLFSWSVIYIAPHVRKRIFNLDKLDLNNPSIIITNHTSFLDILLMLMLSPKIIIVVKDWVYKSILFGPIVRYAGFIYIGDGPEENLKRIKKRIDDGYSLMIFPEGSRSHNDIIKRFHKGAFYIAKELELDITPILIHGASYVLPKTEFFVKHGALNLKILPRIKFTDLSWGETFGKRTKSISRYYKLEYSKFKEEQETGRYLFNRVFTNYIYKGPLLEWYLKIKWKLEYKNYEFYNVLLKDKANILDIGCGYGYLSYYLHYKDENRKILGVDYDEEKISIAINGYDKKENLQFRKVDITNYDVKEQDAILLNDVLHYFSEEKQLKLLNKCVESLNDKGIILIRDGITDLKERHEKTQFTEFLSTKILSFNKKEDHFHFFSSDYMMTFAKKHNLLCEMVEQSQKTSNVLFILKKQ